MTKSSLAFILLSNLFAIFWSVFLIYYSLSHLNFFVVVLVVLIGLAIRLSPYRFEYTKKNLKYSIPLYRYLFYFVALSLGSKFSTPALLSIALLYGILNTIIEYYRLQLFKKRKQISANISFLVKKVEDIMVRTNLVGNIGIISFVSLYHQKFNPEGIALLLVNLISQENLDVMHITNKVSLTRIFLVKLKLIKDKITLYPTHALFVEIILFAIWMDNYTALKGTILYLGIRSVATALQLIYFDWYVKQHVN